MKQNKLNLKQKIESEYNQLLNSIKSTDYTQASIYGAQVGFADEIKSAEKFIKVADETENLAKKTNEMQKNFFAQIRNDLKPKLSKDIFTFPKGEPEEVYNLQLSALKCANTCYNNYNNINETVEEYDCESKQLKEQNEKIFDSTVCIYGLHDKEKIKCALKNSVDKDKLKDYANELAESNNLKIDYKTARIIKNALQNAKIKATIINKNYEKVLKDNFETEKEKLQDKCNNTKKELINYENINKLKKNLSYHQTFIWMGFVFLFFPILTIGGCAYGLRIINILAFLLPPFLIGFTYFTCGYILYFIKHKKYKSILIEMQEAESTANYLSYTIIDTFSKKFDFYEIYESVDKVISEVYDRRSFALKRAEEVYGMLAKICKNMSKEYKDTIDYLPPTLDISTLPRIIELMEKGSATDYKTAVWQVEQEMRDDRANKKKLAILEAAEAARQTELHAQRIMQEYYERQRLNIAREQAESQRRAERYAKEQAETAQKQLEASEAAARAAEKQAEETEELLRRSNDPYYINKWKNGEV